MPKRKSNTIPAKWRKLLKSLPGYDPFEQAGGYEFDAKPAQRAIDFFAELKHVKGPMAGQPFILETWQKAVVANLYGWKRKADGRRRYREVFVYVAKKNGKSCWAGALILYALFGDGELGAEVYSAAASREQAAVVFAYAAGMVKLDPVLKKRLKVYGHRGGSVTKAIMFADTMSSYKCLAADAHTVDGVNPSFVVIDELHRHKSPELADVLQRSTAARAEPIVIYTTTADHNRPSLCNTKLAYAKSVRNNGGDPSKPGFDPSFLPVIYAAEASDDWQSPKTWAKANPNLDVTVSSEFLAREAQKAAETPTELNSFLRLHLNIVTDANVAWLTMDKWDACGGDVDVESLVGERCFMGLDLANTIDIAAAVLYFPDSGAALPFFWVPEDNAVARQRKDKVPYQTWTTQEYITATEGSVIDQDVIRRDIVALGKTYNIAEIAIDRWNATQITTQLQGDGFTVTEFGQGYASMSAPSKELERLILTKHLSHGDNPVLRWMTGNVMVETDAAGNIKPSKKKSTEKIDGIVALVMAVGCAMVVSDDGPSVYEDRGMITV